MAKITKSILAAALSVIVAETGEAGFSYQPVDIAEALEKDGKVEINREMTDAEGRVAVRSLAPLETKNEAVTPAPAKKVQSTMFEIEDVAVTPSRRGSAGRAMKYPFDKLEVGQSFRVPCEEGQTPEELLKKLQSNIAGAKDKFSEEHPTETKTNRSGETVPVKVYTRNFAATIDGDGVRVGRVAV